MNSADSPAPVSGGPPPVSYLARRSLRFWRPAAIVFAVAVVATLIFARKTWQPYKSEAVLMYDTTVTRDMGGFDPAAAGARLKEMLHQSDRIRTVIAKYNLFQEFSTAGAIEEVKKRLEFTVQPGGTFSASYIGFSPQEAQAVLRDLVQGLLDDHNRERGKGLENTRALLAAERKRLEEDVRAREIAVQDFVGKHPAVASLNEQDTTSFNPTIALLEQDLKKVLSSPAAAGDTSRSAADLIEQRRQAESDLQRAQRELQDKLVTLTEAHPDVIGARDRVARAQETLNRVRQNLA
ncbi:MAG TPA: hypothetical protein VGG33_13505, partial [Polyangia bacterium]